MNGEGVEFTGKEDEVLGASTRACCQLRAFLKLINKLVEGSDSKTPQATAGHRPFQGFDEGLHGMVHNNFPPARTLAAKSDPG